MSLLVLHGLEARLLLLSDGKRRELAVGNPHVARDEAPGAAGSSDRLFEDTYPLCASGQILAVILFLRAVHHGCSCPMEWRSDAKLTL